ncbi:hypothetical protein [uncultured Agrobacterium sp.]|uniref:hypothetical protein n=1 Tax=Agrobacterium sp. OT33 TaxID=2815338 RepID=UPI001A8C1672|nr:hypothetical protein [uncultured Agrobacterium sp.]MBO0128157.1 hypothetical protein [Agrobacterium sp. OT33]
MLKDSALSFEERLAVCESHFDFRADIVVVYGRWFAGFGMIFPPRADCRSQTALPDRLRQQRCFAGPEKRHSQCLYVVQEDIPNLFLPHYLRKKR